MWTSLLIWAVLTPHTRIQRFTFWWWCLLGEIWGIFVPPRVRWEAVDNTTLCGDNRHVCGIRTCTVDSSPRSIVLADDTTSQLEMRKRTVRANLYVVVMKAKIFEDEWGHILVALDGLGKIPLGDCFSFLSHPLWATEYFRLWMTPCIPLRTKIWRSARDLHGSTTDLIAGSKKEKEARLRTCRWRFLQRRKPQQGDLLLAF